MEGLPYALVMSVSLVAYKNLGVPNAQNVFFVSLLYLPWVIKPLWSPVVDVLRTRRWWTWRMQIMFGAAFAGVALALPASHFFQITLALFWLAAFASATHATWRRTASICWRCRSMIRRGSTASARRFPPAGDDPCQGPARDPRRGSSRRKAGFSAAWTVVFARRCGDHFDLWRFITALFYRFPKRTNRRRQGKISTASS